MIAVIRARLRAMIRSPTPSRCKQPATAVQVHVDHCVEIFALEVAIRPCPAESLEEHRPPATFFAGRDAGGDDLLREDIERRGGLRRAIQVAALDRPHQRRCFDQLVGRQRKQPPLGHLADRMTRSADALQERRDRARRADLHHEIDVADIDAQLERRRGHQCPKAAGLEPMLGIEPSLFRQAAVMASDLLFAQHFS